MFDLKSCIYSGRKYLEINKLKLLEQKCHVADRAHADLTIIAYYGIA